MSEHLTVSQLRRSTQLTQEWLLDLAEREPFSDEDEAYSLLRAVLHAVRDRLTPEEVAHLGAQLPMLVRGLYFEGWRPALAPNEWDTAEAFYDQVRKSLAEFPLAPDRDVEAGARTTLAFLADAVGPGQLRHVEEQLPDAVQELFPDASAA